MYWATIRTSILAVGTIVLAHMILLLLLEHRGRISSSANDEGFVDFACGGGHWSNTHATACGKEGCHSPSYNYRYYNADHHSDTATAARRRVTWRPDLVQEYRATQSGLLPTVHSSLRVQTPPPPPPPPEPPQQEPSPEASNPVVQNLQKEFQSWLCSRKSRKSTRPKSSTPTASTATASTPTASTATAAMSPSSSSTAPPPLFSSSSYALLEEAGGDANNVANNDANNVANNVANTDSHEPCGYTFGSPEGHAFASF